MPSSAVWLPGDPWQAEGPGAGSASVCKGPLPTDVWSRGRGRLEVCWPAAVSAAEPAAVVGVVDVADDLPLAVDWPPDLHVFPTHVGGALASHDILASDIAEVVADLRRERGSGQLEGRRFLVFFDNWAPSIKQSLVRPVSWRC